MAMRIWQAAIIMAVSLLFSYALWRFLRKFKGSNGVNPALYSPLFIALAVFAIGFCLRLDARQEAIDIGYYLTDASVLFMTIMFTAALILGQQKYWET